MIGKTQNAPNYKAAARSYSLSAAPIFVMGVAIMGPTIYLAYDLHIKKRYPWQHGVTLSDVAESTLYRFLPKREEAQAKASES